MERLQNELNALLSKLPNEEDFRERLESLVSVYPFSEFEYIISTLIGHDALSLEDYYGLRDSYIERNYFLYVFEISAPRKFGETWAQGQVKSLVPELEKPSKSVDPDYSGQYDFFLDGIRIEVKASRAVDADTDGPLYVKALASDSRKGFWMNFQQMKPDLCDVFVWVAVWRDVIRYWVLSSTEVKNNRYYSTGQHRGNVGEGQLHVREDNIHDFDAFEVKPNQLADGIRAAFNRRLLQ
ncbi:MAG: hypothetical protein OXG23_11760 [Chloroflexi bacterium]|nr:hypothetical protein [Chloroflexota bacterium]